MFSQCVYFQYSIYIYASDLQITRQLSLSIDIWTPTYYVVLSGQRWSNSMIRITHTLIIVNHNRSSTRVSHLGQTIYKLNSSGISLAIDADTPIRIRSQ